MKKLSSIVLVVISSLFFLNGCLMSQFDQINTQVIKQQKNIIEFTVIEGKTTKQEILAALGNPDSMTGDSLQYNYYSREGEQLNLRIVQKDNTSFNLVFSSGPNVKGWVTFNLNDEYSGKKINTVSDVTFG